MISLRDSIEIHTTPGQIFAWLERMPQEYEAWHPDHFSCRVLHGSVLEVGSELEFKEYIHGKLHSIRFRITKVVIDKRVEFVIKGMGRGAFEVQEDGNTVRFVAELDIGPDAPIIGRLFDLIFSWLSIHRIEALRQHMAEEGRNLKAILESGSSISVG